jgi:hypothetical protein
MTARPPERPLPDSVRIVGVARRRRRSERVWLLGEIGLAYVRARRAVRTRPIEQAVAELRERGARARRFGDSLEEARRLGYVVSRVLPFMPGDTRCLARSLVLTQLLSRRGIEARLIIGARPHPEFLAHAWVEYRGTPVLDPGDGSFGRLVEI